MEKLTLTKEQARELIAGDLPGFVTIKDGIVGQSRWSNRNRIVVQREADGRFFADTYSYGKTESQDEQPYEYEEPNFTEVHKKEKTTYIYE